MCKEKKEIRARKCRASRRPRLRLRPRPGDSARAARSLIVLVLREDVLHLLAGAEEVALVEALPPLLHKNEDAGKLVVLQMRGK